MHVHVVLEPQPVKNNERRGSLTAWQHTHTVPTIRRDRGGRLGVI